MKDSKEELKWVSYKQYMFEKLYFRVKEWFIFNYGFEYNPTEEEIKNLMENPDIIKDTL